MRIYFTLADVARLNKKMSIIEIILCSIWMIICRTLFMYDSRVKWKNWIIYISTFETSDTKSEGTKIKLNYNSQKIDECRNIFIFPSKRFQWKKHPLYSFYHVSFLFVSANPFKTFDMKQKKSWIKQVDLNYILWTKKLMRHENGSFLF